MALKNILLLNQIAGYVIAFILSLCITIPMTLHQDKFRGHCLLFSTGTWNPADGQFVVDWASQAYCNYTIFVGILLLLVSGFQIYRMSKHMYNDTDSDFLSAFFDVIGCLILSGMSIIAAVMITFGFISWCNSITSRFQSCDEADGQNIDRHDQIDTDNFYIELGTAQFGAWASMACWVGLSVFALLKMCQQHEIRNMRVSMMRERQKLINEGGNTSEKSGSGTGEQYWAGSSGPTSIEKY